ncbi:hypothetical protein J9305_08085 [Leptospira interrogans]|uniref:Uncharacterized protein n=2 Tax=Leptospira interrogans TaxID=173 RepID=A0AAQ0AYW4_LEPIR|nr:hypothetical protein [Leptospira interrogans]MBM2889168.1 hypothetical protein [Leptospira interrogans]MCL8309539.1 hypothetical protein [Leptospira interrogans]QOI42760.1 hypothetical protein Lepto782_11105 [Leptospira interrogans serovar Canicola]UID84898.1 hypothetical protein J9305_08085 [Leptospira interrogans]WOT11902.1 hypothetical protein CFY92_0005265 [Leptospira interrogans]
MTSNSTHLSLTKVFQNLLEVITLNLSKRDSKLYQKKSEIFRIWKGWFCLGTNLNLQLFRKKLDFFQI